MLVQLKDPVCLSSFLCLSAYETKLPPKPECNDDKILINKGVIKLYVQTVHQLQTLHQHAVAGPVNCVGGCDVGGQNKTWLSSFLKSSV